MSAPSIFCNVCGKEVTIAKSMGGKFLGYRVCSAKCCREARWRDTLHIMRKDYYPDLDPQDPERYTDEPEYK